jgi:S-adenosylmethionine-diacylgycerolhomoserine-N-methlytransferase
MSLRDWLGRFAAPELNDYDDFRDRMLHGREELIFDLGADSGSVWVELGAGTGRNLEFLGDRLKNLAHVYLVDFARPLLTVAERRCRQHANVTVVEADAAKTGLPDRVADVVLCSYSLTMMPAWRDTIEEARRLLTPGGWIGVVDFHQPAWAPPMPWPQEMLTHHVLPWWLRQRHVALSSEHLAVLLERFRVVSLDQAYGPIPYLPGVRAPFYRFIGAR